MCGTMHTTTVTWASSSISPETGRTNMPSSRSVRSPKTDKYWNLVTGEHIGSKFEIDTFTSALHQSKVAPATERFGAITNYVTMTQGFNRSSLQAFFNQTNYNLLRRRGLTRPTIQTRRNSPGHPTTTKSSNRRSIFKPNSATASIMTPTACRTTGAIFIRRFGTSLSASPSRCRTSRSVTAINRTRSTNLNASINSSRQWRQRSASHQFAEHVAQPQPAILEDS